MKEILRLALDGMDRSICEFGMDIPPDIMGIVLADFVRHLEKARGHAFVSDVVRRFYLEFRAPSSGITRIQ